MKWRMILVVLAGLSVANLGCTHRKEPSPPPAPTASISASSFGVVWKDEITAADLGCSVNLSPASPEQIASSPLKLTAGYLPEGFELGGTVASACDGQVVSLATVYRNGRREITIARFRGKVLPRTDESIETDTVSQKSALRIGMYQLVLLEDWGLTSIKAPGLALAEFGKIASNIR